MDTHRSSLIQNLNLNRNSLAWEFVAKSCVNYNEKHPAWLCSDIPKKTPGIYSVATDTEFLYIGFSGRDIRHRFAGSEGLSKKVEHYLKQQGQRLQDQKIYTHWMPFSVGEPIGRVYATHTGNCHESILISQLRPVLNRRMGSFLCFDEEIFYRRLIVENGTTDGFSKYLTKQLLLSHNLIRGVEPWMLRKWRMDNPDLLLRLTNHIIQYSV